ncbi:MAG: beta-N-acetylglucosaminidase domain-containing protein [Planctomycetota bacterium]|jgi:hypothetical protein
MNLKPYAAFIVTLTMFLTLAYAQDEPPSGITNIIPRPKVEAVSKKPLIIAEKNTPICIDLGNTPTSGPVTEGLKLLKKRLQILAQPVATEKTEKPQIIIRQCSKMEMIYICKYHGLLPYWSSLRFRQCYDILMKKTKEGVPEVTIRSRDERGLFYGIVSLCQLLEKDDQSNLIVPEGEIVDFPELAHRLAKTSATHFLPKTNRRLAEWLSLMKFSLIGLQFHGENSKNPDANFKANLTKLCPQLRQDGIIRPVVYFCPFKGKPGQAAYDFTSPKDRKAYADFLLWIMDRGAYGIEVDYNDWPDTNQDLPIADVLNLAHETLKAKNPYSYLLYCPPLKGQERYRGPATAQLFLTLNQVSKRIWPLWTGMTTRIAKPLTNEQIEKWTRMADRKPFLWINRVGLGVKHSFSRKLQDPKDAHVFLGERLPKDLYKILEGIHLNISMGHRYNKPANQFNTDALAYLITAADYIWNPQAWNPNESARRAQLFVKTMTPLIRNQPPTTKTSF